MLKKFKSAAKNTLLTNKRMNIGIAEKNIPLLKTKTFKIGIPYQPWFQVYCISMQLEN